MRQALCALYCTPSPSALQSEMIAKPWCSTELRLPLQVEISADDPYCGVLLALVRTLPSYSFPCALMLGLLRHDIDRSQD